MLTMAFLLLNLFDDLGYLGFFDFGLHENCALLGPVGIFGGLLLKDLAVCDQGNLGVINRHVSIRVPLASIRQYLQVLLEV